MKQAETHHSAAVIKSRFYLCACSYNIPHFDVSCCASCCSFILYRHCLSHLITYLLTYLLTSLFIYLLNYLITNPLT